LGHGSNTPPTIGSTHNTCFFFPPFVFFFPVYILPWSHTLTTTINTTFTHSGPTDGTKRRLKANKPQSSKRTLKETTSNAPTEKLEELQQFEFPATDSSKAETEGREPHPRKAKKAPEFSYLRHLSIPVDHMRRSDELMPFGTGPRASNLVRMGESTLHGAIGWGLFAGDKGFKEGDFIGLYSGERYATAEKAFEAAAKQGTQNKIFEMPAKFKNRFVVPRRNECPGSLINDALTQAAPNCEIRTNLVTGKNLILALRDLEPYEELFMEYGPGCWDGQWDLADVNDILGAYPELIGSFEAYQEAREHNEIIDLDYLDDAASGGDSGDHSVREEKEGSNGDRENTDFSTPTGSDSSLQASRPPMAPRLLAKSSNMGVRFHPEESAPDLHGEVDTPLQTGGEETKGADPHDRVMEMITRIPLPNAEGEDEERPPVFRAVHARTARRYLAQWQLYIEYCSSVCFRLDSWEGLSRPASLAHVKSYLEWLRKRGRNVSTALTALRKGLSDRGHDTTILSSQAIIDAKKEGAPSQREKSKRAEVRFRAAVPFEFVRSGVLSGWDEKAPYEKVVAAASLLMYDRSKRVCTVAHTHHSEAEGGEGNALLCEDVVLMDSAYHYTRYDPISYRKEMSRLQLRASQDPNSSIRYPSIDYLKLIFRSDKIPGEATVVCRRTSSGSDHGCPLEDTLMDRLVEVCLLGEHTSLQDMFFSLPSVSPLHPRKRLCSKDITAILKTQARCYRLPAKYFSSHSYRITGKTNVTIANHACNHLPKEADLNLMIGWSASSTSAPRYVRPSYMGHSNLRQVSTGNPDHYVSLGDVILSLPAATAGGAGSEDGESSSEDSVSSLSTGPSKEPTKAKPRSRPVGKTPVTGRKRSSDQTLNPTSAPNGAATPGTTTKMITRGSSGKKKPTGTRHK
jgi:hypothetical protein